MGKSLGKWMKTLIFGKKSSRSKNVKANNEKKGDDNEAPVSVDQIWNTNLSLNVSRKSDMNLEENLQSDHSQNEEITELNAENDSDRTRDEQAAKYMQAALRGYLVRRAFRTLKGIIRLQALIRGHLVRRQAVSTLYCMFQIVKFQALARGRKIRHSDIGIQVQKQCARLKHNHPVMSCVHISKQSTNGFALKILASSPTVTPLHFHYDPNETNSVSSWLDRWSTSKCWQLLPQPKSGQPSKPHTRRSSITHVEIIASEFDKSIRNLKKVSSNKHENLIEESPELVLERVKRSLRKVNNPVLDTETVTQKIITEPEREKVKLGVRVTESFNIRENEKEGENVGESNKLRKKVHVPIKQEFVENKEPLRMKRLVPNYMTATVSAKAKLRGQNDAETPTNLTRRYSLPSNLTNAKLSVSPRVQTTGKLKNDRILQLSGDRNVTVNQAEWRL